MEKNIVYVLFNWLMWEIILWNVYVHIYGIQLTFKKEKKLHLGIRYKEQGNYGRMRERIGQYKVTAVLLSISRLILLIADFQAEHESTLLIFMILANLYYSILAKEKKLRTGLLWLWAVLLTAELPLVFMNAISYGASMNEDLNNDLLEFFMEVITLFIVLGIAFLDRKYKFSRRIREKERFLLVIIVSCISMVGINGYSEEYCLTINGSKSQALLLYLVFSIFALIMMIRVISVGTVAYYYEQLSLIHEKNAKEILHIYESYREAQEETRKLRHDMKNHFSCIQILAQERNYKELDKYMENFHEALSDISMELQTGNEIVDAILNVKNKIAKEEKIELKVEGMIPYMPFIASMDWCKIFSNVIDNGIEALQNIVTEDKKLTIQLKSNEHFFMIYVENPCANYVDVSAIHVPTSKRDKIGHGFGIQNIRETVKKYNGELNLSCKKTEEGYLFISQIVLPRSYNINNHSVTVQKENDEQ